MKGKLGRRWSLKSNFVLDASFASQEVRGASLIFAFWFRDLKIFPFKAITFRDSTTLSLKKFYLPLLCICVGMKMIKKGLHECS